MKSVCSLFGASLTVMTWLLSPTFAGEFESMLGGKMSQPIRVKILWGRRSRSTSRAGSLRHGWKKTKTSGQSCLRNRKQPVARWVRRCKSISLQKTPYYRQEAPALALRGNEVFITWSLSHPKATPDKPFSSDLRLSRSSDDGKTFAPSTLVNDDGQVINHTFDALQVSADGRVHFAWIDGREGKKEPGTFVATSTDQGRTVGKNTKVDDNTCVCCRIALATTLDGTVYVAWRKIFEGNVRETVVARSSDGGETYSSPAIVGHDRWVYQACPHRPASLGVDRQGRLFSDMVHRGRR